MQVYFGNKSWIRGASFYLRYQVFVLEQGILPELEFDETDTSDNYFLLMENNVPIATLRYQKKSSTCLNPDRFCVSKNYRQQGFGRQLLSLAEQKKKKIKPGYKKKIDWAIAEKNKKDRKIERRQQTRTARKNKKNSNK